MALKSESSKFNSSSNSNANSKANSNAIAGYTIVTGASSGIGLEIAKRLAELGRPLILVARREEVLQQLAKGWREKFGAEIKVCAADLSREEQRLELIKFCTNLPLEGLVNNAGYGASGRFWERKWPVFRDMLEVNCTALMHLTHAILPVLVNQGHGRILNVASTAAFQPGPYFNVYSATKAFVLSFGEALNEELRGSGVTVTTLCPGYTESEFHVRAGTGDWGKTGNRLRATASSVARRGVEAMDKGERIAIPGLLNRALAFTSRHLPKSVVVKAAGAVFRSRGQ
jgi:uncharacterized protein